MACFAAGWQPQEAAALRLPAMKARRALWRACPALGAALPNILPHDGGTSPAATQEGCHYPIILA